MKVYEVLALNEELLKKIYVAGIKPDDYKYVKLYTDFMAMKSKGEKVTYIVSLLSENYGISERKVYSIIGKMSREILTVKTVQ